MTSPLVTSCPGQAAPSASQLQHFSPNRLSDAEYVANIGNIDIHSTSSRTHSPPLMPSPRRTASPPNLPTVLTMKRSNPKRLALSLSLPGSSSSTSSSSPSQSTPVATSTIATTPTTMSEGGSKYNTPYTPGPPQTPALALTMPMGRATSKGLRRPSLLSLITQPPTNTDVPLKPSGVVHPYATTGHKRVRPRSSSGVEDTGGYQPIDRGFRSAHPSSQACGPIHESEDLSSLGSSLPRTTSPSTSPSSNSATPSESSTPSTSPPLLTSSTIETPPYGSRPAEPYEDGPIEILPNVFLGAEESVHDLIWARGSRVVRILNVAQEIDDPFASADLQGKESRKVRLARYEGAQPTVEYGHLRWSHGEGGLADLPEGADLRTLISGDLGVSFFEKESWVFWDAIRWLEDARRQGIPILVHCQCGVSRSATLVIAYIMSLSAAGLVPSLLGHLHGMQDAYDFVKAKSPWIGPNVSLVFQLVEYQRNLTSLLSRHLGEHPGSIETSFPTFDTVISEDEWARRRREFEEEGQLGDILASPGPISPEEMHEAGVEAMMLDQAMEDRKRWRV